MCKKQEFKDQIKEIKRKIEEYEELLEDLYFRLDAEQENLIGSENCAVYRTK